MTLNLEDSKDNEDKSIGDILKNILLKIFENPLVSIFRKFFFGQL